MRRIRKSFKTVADAQAFSARIEFLRNPFRRAPKKMLDLGQSRSKLEAVTAIGRNITITKSITSDAISSSGLGLPGVVNIAICDCDCFVNGMFVPKGSLGLTPAIPYTIVWPAARTSYLITLPQRLFKEEITFPFQLSLDQQQFNSLITLLKSVTDGQDITAPECAAQIQRLMKDASFEPFSRDADWEMSTELIRIAHSQTPEERIKLPDLSRLLLTNKDKLTQTSNELLGITPMALLRNARLQQCRYLIQEGNKSIEQIRISYGFSNRKDFNNRYAALFDELPTATRTNE